MSLIFLLVLALSPGLAIILYIYLKDKHEPEPIKPLTIGFVSGIVAFIIAIGFGAVLQDHIDIRDHNI
jgi:RsiW-degrading membrane proteinase PrsW (M82 family)